MALLKRIRGRHQYRLVLCGHKAAEAGAVCLVLMVQGQLMDATLSHLLIAKSPVERMHLTFEQFAEDLDNGVSSDGPPTRSDRSSLKK